MLEFIVRRFFLLLLTMLLVSVAVFLITESSPGKVARNVLGAFVTPEQEAAFLAQQGLDRPQGRGCLSEALRVFEQGEADVFLKQAKDVLESL